MVSMQEAIDIVLALPGGFIAVRRELVEEKAEPASATVFALQERLRLHTQMVRNWAATDR